jgi:hypothetical protein
VRGPEELFEQLEAQLHQQSRPPVHLWSPESVGRIDIRIARDGSWHHQGSPITRAAMVQAFASVLCHDEDGYALVTPVEKLLIEVEDTPFVAVDCDTRGQGRDMDLMFTTNTGELVMADDAHPLSVSTTGRGAYPVVEVRPGLTARIAQAVYYRLVELGVEEGGELVLYSAGSRFSLGSLT